MPENYSSTLPIAGSNTVIEKYIKTAHMLHSYHFTIVMLFIVYLTVEFPLMLTF